MRRRIARVLCLVIFCGSIWSPSASIAAPDAPTAQALVAQLDAEFVKGAVAWNKGAFELPSDMELDSSLRNAVAPLVADLLARLQTLIPKWIAEERAAVKDPSLRGAILAQAILMRSINEMAISSVESVGPSHDDAWLKAALAPGACRAVYPANFARRIAMIQTAPIEVRPALLAAEKELLSRWGTERRDLPPRPAAMDLAAAQVALTRVREGLPINAVPMTPLLAGQVFARDRKPGKPDAAVQCLMSQWWLESQIADGGVDKARALALYRYSTLADVDSMVPARFKSESEPIRQADGKPAYPRAARYFQVEGTTTMKVSLDEKGRVLRADVVARQIKAPGIHNNRPLAFESLLDEAALEFARQRAYAAGRARDEQFVMNWRLKDDGNEAR